MPTYFDRCDVQLAPSVAFCGVCRGEIYRYDQVAAVSGRLVHEDCIPDDMQEYAVFPACSYFEEA